MTPTTPAPRAANTARRHSIASGALASVLLIAAAATAIAQTTQPTAPPARPTLFAYGAADRYWVAVVEPYKADGKPQFKTLVRGQSLPGGEWRDLGTLHGHASAIAQAQGDLAVLMDDGGWMRLGGAGLSTGADLPGSGDVLAWGSAGQTLYAVRAVEGGRAGLNPNRAADAPQPPATTATAAAAATAPAATRPATRATISTLPSAPTAAAAAKPATRPLGRVLFQMDRGEWSPVADLPPEARGAVKFSVSGTAGNPGTPGKPLLAVAAESSPVRIWALADGRWESLGEITPPGPVVNFDVIVAGGAPAFWSLDAAGVASLYVRREGQDWSKPVALLAPGGVAPSAQRTLAAAGEDLRLVLLKDGKLLEQRYDTAGAAKGSLVEMPAPKANTGDPFANVFKLFLLIALVVAVLVTFYKRRKDSGAAPGNADRKGDQ